MFSSKIIIKFHWFSCTQYFVASANWEYFHHRAGLDFQAFTSKFYISWRLNGSPADLAIFTTFIFHFHRMLCHGAVAIRQLCESIQLCKVSNWNYVSGGGELRTLTVVHSAPEYFHCKINFIRRHRSPAPALHLLHLSHLEINLVCAQ